jgi:hypothetical protein
LTPTRAGSFVTGFHTKPTNKVADVSRRNSSGKKDQDRVRALLQDDADSLIGANGV